MWQNEPSSNEPARAPDSWTEIRRRLDQQMVGAYCAMLFDRHPVPQALQDYGIDPDDLEAVIRRGVLVYGHDFEQVMNRLVPDLRDAG